MGKTAFRGVVAAVAAAACVIVCGRTVDSNYALSADEDWSGDGTVSLAHGTTVDLAGHSLKVAGLSVKSAGLAVTNEAGVVAGYSDLAYLDTCRLDSSGGRGTWVATDFAPRDSDTIEAGLMFLGEYFSESQMIWCDRTGQGTDTFTALKYGSKFRFDRCTKMTGANVYVIAPETNYTVVANYANGVCSVNGEDAGTMDDLESFTPPTNLVLFASFTIDKSGNMAKVANIASIRFYYLKVWRDGTLAAHFVPVCRKSDGEIGVYDRVGGRFYTNAGEEGEFTAWTPGTAEITSSATGDPGELHLDIPAYQELEYIQPRGSGYIVTDYVPRCTDRAEMGFCFSTTNGPQCLFCTRKAAKEETFTVFALRQTGGLCFRFDRNKTQKSNYDVLVQEDTYYKVVANGDDCKLSVNGEELATSGSGTFTPHMPFILFASSTAAEGTAEYSGFSNYAKGKCYYFRVYDSSGDLKCDMVPARNPAGVDGMYDKIGKKFHPCSGENNFSNSGPAKSSPAAFKNEQVAFTGNLKVVKEGIGTFVPARAGQAYTGGTQVNEGLLESVLEGSQNPLGADESAITVSAGGVFELNGLLQYNRYAFVLDGGVLTNSVTPDKAYNHNCIADIALTADSQFVTGGRYSLSQKTNGAWSVRLDLAGHRLTIRTPGAIYFRAVEAVSAGTVELHGPRLIEFIGNDSDLRKVDVVVTDGGQLRVDNARTVKLGGYASDTEAQDDDSRYDGKLEVYGTFRPDTDYFRGCELQDGATIDVSGRSTALPLQSLIGANCSAAAKTVTFATNATITVDWGDRNLSSGEPIVSWTVETRPSNLSTLTFKATAAHRTFELSRRSNGLYLPSGTSILIR